jgi:hypothetical protein
MALYKWSQYQAVVAETLAEQQRLRHDDMDAVVLKNIATILVSFGIEERNARKCALTFSI